MNQLVNYTEHPVSDMERMAKAFVGSKLFGVQNIDQALALCLVAQAEGRHPASAAQDYHIINGRPAKKADAMLRDFLAGGGKVQWHELTDDIAAATFSHPAGGSARIDWTMERAKKAGLATAMWGKYPRQMLRSRVVSEGVRTIYPMATSGMYVPEEVQEFEPDRRGTVEQTVRDVTSRDTAPQITDDASGKAPPKSDAPTPPPRTSFNKTANTSLDGFVSAMKLHRSVEAVDAWAAREANTIMEKLGRTDQDKLQAAYEDWRNELAAHDEPSAKEAAEVFS